MEKTYWTAGEKKKYPALNENIEVDAAIIGGGLAGLMCAEELSRRGSKVCILEARSVGEGETCKSSAMISYAHDLIYARLIQKHGKQLAMQYLNLGKYGLERIRNLTNEFSRDCELQNCDMYLYAITQKGAKQLFKEHGAYSELNENTRLTTETELPFPVTQALCIKDQSYLNPLKFVGALAEMLHARGVQIFENTFVSEPPQKNMLSVGDFTVRANHFIVATHFPCFNFPGYYFLKMYQSRSHNVVFQGEPQLINLYESVEKNGFEYRPVKDGILCGGANIRTGKYKYRSQYEIVRHEIAHRFNVEDQKILHQFSAQDCITLDMLPFAGKYCGGSDNVYVITGFNKWGFTTSAATAKLIADAIEGKKSENIFDPDRLYALKTPLKTLKNIAAVLSDYGSLLISTDAKKLARIKPGQGAVVRHGGKRLGVYRTEDNRLEIVSAVCPHLGCALKWNKDEKTWDCPCHGSRFDTKGNICNNPSLKPAVAIKTDDHA